MTEARVHAWLHELRRAAGSDLHLAAARPPFVRIAGQMGPMPGETALADAELRPLLREIAGEDRWARFLQTRDIEFVFLVDDGARFRCSYFESREGAGAVFHLVPDRITPIEQLGAPDAVHRLADLDEGLVLVAGPTGCGASTTLAAIIDRINRKHDRHIVTIETPVEFVHENRRSVISQRDLSAHPDGIAAAVRDALRQDADVILIGELAAPDVLAAAIEAAALGTLVFGAFPTPGAERTIERVIGAFPSDRREQARSGLAETLTAVVCQALVRRTLGGRVAAHEILLRTPALAGAIREGKTGSIPALIEGGRSLGMQTLDQALRALVEEGVIDGHEAFLAASDKNAFRRWAQER